MSGRLSRRSAIVAAAFVATYAVTHGGSPAAYTPAEPLDSLPLAMGEWAGSDAPPLDDATAEVLAADQYVRRYYEGPAGTIEMDVAYYARPRIGTTMHSPLNCLPGTGWEVASVATRQLGPAAGGSAGPAWQVRELTVVRANARYALTYWYQSRHRIIADEFAARFNLLGDALKRRPTDAGLVRVMMPVAGGSGEAERGVLARFAQLLIPQIDSRIAR
jgi:EpsI family protein